MDATEPDSDWHMEQIELYEEEEEELKDDFPQFQTEFCVELMQDVCEHGAVEGRCCLEERRRIMEDASHLLDAWMSADILKKMFRRLETPVHFKKVIEFLK